MIKGIVSFIVQGGLGWSCERWGEKFDYKYHGHCKLQLENDGGM